ncbi:MAG: ATP-dependent zinc protease [Longimicrobiales bacterium]
MGWREWVALPELGVDRIKAKVDTGARSSSLHAFEIERFRRKGVSMVRFAVHPIQRTLRGTVRAEAEVVDQRKVKTSSGVESLRWVIVSDVELMDQRWPIEVTLTRRDTMGFRMLLGRQAIRGHFLVDPGRSFLGEKPTVSRRRSSGRSAFFPESGLSIPRAASGKRAKSGDTRCGW